jgi:general secretion pathway protein B
MSLILEALRRSEAERRRGQTPDLLSDATPIAPAAENAMRTRNASIAMAAAALATLLLVAWWLRPALESAAGSTAREPAAVAIVSSSAALPVQPLQSRKRAPVATAATAAMAASTATTPAAAPLAPPLVASPRARPPAMAGATPDKREPRIRRCRRRARRGAGAHARHRRSAAHDRATLVRQSPTCPCGSRTCRPKNASNCRR